MYSIVQVKKIFTNDREEVEIPLPETTAEGETCLNNLKVGSVRFVVLVFSSAKWKMLVVNKKMLVVKSLVSTYITSTGKI